MRRSTSPRFFRLCACRFFVVVAHFWQQTFFGKFWYGLVSFVHFGCLRRSSAWLGQNLRRRPGWWLRPSSLRFFGLYARRFLSFSFFFWQGCLSIFVGAGQAQAVHAVLGLTPVVFGRFRQCLAISYWPFLVVNETSHSRAHFEAGGGGFHEGVGFVSA